MSKIRSGEKTTEQLKEDLRKTREELAIQKWGIEKTLGGMKVLVTELIQKGKELAEAYESLEKIDKAKTEFISIASHQLRTPVSGLSWLTEALQFTSENLNPKQIKYLGDLAILSKRLTGIIEDLLDFSRIELKTASVAEKQKIEIPSFVEEFIKEMDAYAVSKNHSIILKKEGFSPTVIEINKRALCNILQNLISNGVDYSPINTAVTVSLENVAGAVKIKVANKGPLIPKADQPRIFDKFYRTADAIKTKPEGTGLGLYIVKKVIEEVGGKVGFESVEGKDIYFWFTVPLKTANEVQQFPSADSSVVK